MVVKSRAHAVCFPASLCGCPVGIARVFEHDVTAPRAPASARDQVTVGERAPTVTSAQEPLLPRVAVTEVSVTPPY